MDTNEVTKAGARRRPVAPPPADASLAYVRLADGTGPGALRVLVVTGLDGLGRLRVTPLAHAEARQREDGSHGGMFVRARASRLYYAETSRCNGYWFVVRDGAICAIPAARAVETARTLFAPPAPRPAPAEVRKRERRVASIPNKCRTRTYRDPRKAVKRGI